MHVLAWVFCGWLLGYHWNKILFVVRQTSYYLSFIPSTDVVPRVQSESEETHFGEPTKQQASTYEGTGILEQSESTAFHNYAKSNWNEKSLSNLREEERFWSQ